MRSCVDPCNVLDGLVELPEFSGRPVVDTVGHRKRRWPSLPVRRGRNAHRCDRRRGRHGAAHERRRDAGGDIPGGAFAGRLFLRCRRARVVDRLRRGDDGDVRLRRARTKDIGHLRLRVGWPDRGGDVVRRGGESDPRPARGERRGDRTDVHGRRLQRGAAGADRRWPGSEQPDLSFEYDAAGRMQRATLGRRTATVEYDALDRTTRLAVDGGTVLEHGYAPDDADAPRQEDLRTGGVLVAAPLSPVFGTMESMVYARPRSAEFGLVAYSPSRKTFEVRPDALAADALLLASLHARMVPLGGEDPNTAPFGHDKPSNSLFIPPEFKAVNCQLCTVSRVSVELSVEPAGTHCPTEYTTVVDGSCGVALPFDSPIEFTISLPWYHRTDFGDGASASELTWDREVSGTHIYALAREYTMSHSVVCPCPSPFADGSDSVTFEVSASDDQSAADYDINGCTFAPDHLGAFVFGTVQGMIPVGSERMVADFPCNQHDLCYETCGIDRATCDNEFRSDMLRACRSSAPCEFAAERFARAVILAGDRAFRREQQEHCLCSD